MPISSKLKADFVELINGELDRIPVESFEDFNLIAQELQNIICFSVASCFKSIFFAQPKSTLPKNTLEQIDYVRFCYNNPKDYVASSEHYSEYQKILKERIQAKIIEFQKFTEKEKQSYMSFQQEIHDPSTKSIASVG
ncbi:Uncharacterised protein [Legionella wadsworthii]|uniref:Uncharacterized protein n=1 Tax=Legionella wadsworthii TaxID=28088 RepID=A0A378LMH2_9GAMM|nr:hypothetical protein [Legionella wadsworthii]STY28205.1 Uncharacterised protein [Legionella wadsworthii]